MLLMAMAEQDYPRPNVCKTLLHDGQMGADQPTIGDFLVRYPEHRRPIRVGGLDCYFL